MNLSSTQSSTPQNVSSSQPSNTNKRTNQSDSRDSNKFEENMKKKENKKNDEDTKSPGDLMRELKEGMNSTSAKMNISTAQSSAIQRTNAADSIDRVNVIVDKIMKADAANTKEVSVSFNNDFLADTQAIIRKNGGTIEVQFTSSSAESLNFLRDNSQSLVQQLQEKSGENVSVDIADSGTHDHDQNQGSRNEYIEEDDQKDR